jgi:hypothetical protein
MVALVAAMSLTLMACGASMSTSALSTGTLTGRVSAGPTCPVERADHPCPPSPVSATVQAKERGRVIASTHTDANGRYRLQLRAGKYTVVAATSKPLPHCAPIKATVRANHTTRAPISCDTGIR